MATQAAKKSTVYRIPEKPERRKVDRRITSAYRLSPDLDPVQLIEDAKKKFYKDPNVIGFGIGAIAPVAAGLILDVATSASRWGLAFSFNGALAVLGVGALLWLRRLPRARQMASGKR